ncbi:unnamed protein product [Musa textilis]
MLALIVVDFTVLFSRHIIVSSNNQILSFCFSPKLSHFGKEQKVVLERIGSSPVLSASSRFLPTCWIQSAHPRGLRFLLDMKVIVIVCLIMYLLFLERLKSGTVT